MPILMKSYTRFSIMGVVTVTVIVMVKMASQFAVLLIVENLSQMRLILP